MANRRFLEGVVAQTLGIPIDKRNGHESHNHERWQNHPGDPRIVIHQHFLKSQEIPWRLGWIGGLCGVGGLFDGRFYQYGPENQEDGGQSQADQLRVDQMGPGEDFFLEFRFFDRSFAPRDAFVVVVPLFHGVPDKETHQEQQA